MKSISLREFQLKASDYLEELPVVLTRYGEPVAVVSRLEKEVVNTSELEGGSVDTSVNTREEAGVSVNTSVDTLEKCIIVGCGEGATALGKIYDPDLGEFVEVPMCKKHAAKSLKESIS